MPVIPIEVSSYDDQKSEVEKILELTKAHSNIILVLKNEIGKRTALSVLRRSNRWDEDIII
jgi:hypothetical protein